MFFRSVLAASLALPSAVGACVSAVAGTLTTAVTLTTAALIVPGTAVPNPAAVAGYMENAVDYYIAPTTPSCAIECSPVPVPYIAQFWPFPWEGWGGLTGAKLDVSVASGLSQLTSDLVGDYRPGAEDPLVVFGYSQGATVASRQKDLLSRLSAEDQSAIDFVLIGNPNRPNGGLFERLAMFGTVPILDATFGLPTPTDTSMRTTDIAFQYDGVADFPLYPLNLLATLNAVAGFWYNHGGYLAPDGRHPDELPNGLTRAELLAAIADPANQQSYGDTTYVLVPTPNLPLLQPLRDFGAAAGLESLTTPLVDLLQPALRVLVETGYDRSLPYGQPAPLRLISLADPIAVTVDLVEAIGQGIRDAIGDVTGPTAPMSRTADRPAISRPERSAPLNARSRASRPAPEGSARRQSAKTSGADRRAAAAAPASRR